MKTVKYLLVGGGEKVFEYDENAPCIICGEPVVEASVGGTAICPWCDMGICRYCRVQLPWGTNAEQTKSRIKEHMAWHKEHPVEAKDETS